MAETLREAVTFIEQGHVRVGPDTVTDPAFHVTRSMEDFVTWCAGLLAVMCCCSCFAVYHAMVGWVPEVV